MDPESSDSGIPSSAVVKRRTLSRHTKSAPITYPLPFQGLLDMIEKGKHENYYMCFRNLESASAAHAVVQGRRMIMLGSNNYLCLTTHPKVKRATIRAIQKYGTGAGGVRMLSGTYRLHEELEEKLAELKRTDSAMVFSAGYTTNVATISTLAELGYVLINDEKNHASIIDGCKTRKAKVCFFRHNNINHLKEILQHTEPGTERFIIADGIFSMDGDIADLPNILSLARCYGAKTYIDDAHATGVIGAHGRGTAEHYGVEGQVDVIIGTLSKALGAVGGFTAGPKDLITYLKHASRAFVFGSALPPSVAATALASLGVLQKEPELLQRLHRNSKMLRDGLKDLGFDVAQGQTPIIPLIVGDWIRAYRFARFLHEAGVFVNPVGYPAVKPKEARIRISVNALLTSREIGSALIAFEQAGKTLRLI